MSLFKKSKKESPEPQYYTSATNEQVYNYNVYYMSKTEKIIYFLAAFFVGAAVGYLFYGGLAKDEYGNSTLLTHILNIIIPSIIGIIAGYLFVPMRNKAIINKKKNQLNTQFRDMLDGLTTALGAGKNVPDSFVSVKEDLQLQYNEDAYILKEINVIISGIENNVPIEELLMDFGKRSGNQDIISFANVFKISYRKGGNLKDIIRNTHEILSDKMAINEEIETAISGSKLNINIMICMPIVLIAVIKMMSPEFAANFATAPGIISTSIAVVLFVIAYFVGKTMMEIKM